jgi:hypothetical protein
MQPEQWRRDKGIVIGFVSVVLFLTSCGLFQHRQIAYLERATGVATQQQVIEEFGPPALQRPGEEGGTIWIYRYAGFASPMLLPMEEAWCVEYVLTFDKEKILRTWVRQDCAK